MKEPIEQVFINYIDRHLSAAPDIDTFYHYTTVEALVNGIIGEDAAKGKEICLRASHCRFMNDSEEIFRGRSIIANALGKIRPQKTREEYFLDMKYRYENLYLISFSEQKDSLPMWNTYSNKSTGVAIGFKRFVSISLDDVVLKCVYDVKEITHILDSHTDSEQEKFRFILTSIYLPQIIKDEAYDYEREVRLIGRFDGTPIKFREKNGYVIPYKEFFFSAEQVSTIVLGPCYNQETAIFSLRRLLDNRGLQHVKIEKSTIPYRNI